MEHQVETRSEQQQNEASSSRFYDEIDQSHSRTSKLDAGGGERESAADKLDRTLIVNHGEGLWSVARRALADEGANDKDGRAITAKVREIIELNRDRFPNLVLAPHRVYPDQWLLVREAKQQSSGQINSIRDQAIDSEESATARDIPAEVEAIPDFIKRAKAGQRVHAVSGEEVDAEKGSKVIAHAGSDVQAMNGSFVLALPGSKVRAFNGSAVADYGGEVDVFKGAVIFDMKSMAASDNYVN